MDILFDSTRLNQTRSDSIRLVECEQFSISISVENRDRNRKSLLFFSDRIYFKFSLVKLMRLDQQSDRLKREYRHFEV